MRRLLAPAALVLAAVSTVAAPTPAHADPTFPKLTGRVVDAANVIPDDEEARLDRKLAALEAQSGRQLVVATIPDLQGYEISDYGYQLGRAWGLGAKAANDGALLIVAPKERKVRIEVGYGLEGVLTDGVSFMVVNQAIVPRFKAGDIPGGIEAGADALVTQLTLPADQARSAAAQADAARNQQAASSKGGIPFGALIPLIFVFLFVVLPMMRGRGRQRGFGGGLGGGLGQIVLWSALNHLGDHDRGGGGGGFGGFGGGGGGGGGGFSGGGGSFGGGGASGSW